MDIEVVHQEIPKHDYELKLAALTKALLATLEKPENKTEDTPLSEAA